VFLQIKYCLLSFNFDCSMSSISSSMVQSDPLYPLVSIFIMQWVRDRPFNLKGRGGGGYDVVFRSEIFFRSTQELEFFFCRAERKFFIQNVTLAYMTKTLNQIIFFSSTKIRIFFSATLGIRIFF
jgi:hypothetical protein